MKKDLKNIFNEFEIVAFLIATIFVILFEFLAYELLFISALVIYVLAFGVMTARFALELDATKKAVKPEPEPEDENKADELKEENLNKVDLGQSRKFIYLKLILSAIMCLFAFIILILF